MDSKQLNHIYQLEAESIYIIREVLAEFTNPVMMYSIGKDSSVMLHLAKKAFYPANLPFPLLHIDTGWKFNEMYDFRDNIVNSLGIELLVHRNLKGVEMGIDPFIHGSTKYTDIMKTDALKQALNKYKFDAAFGGARRDEERSRAKERIYSFRDQFHRWDPKNQRPEIWNNYNGQVNKGENIRVFPLSNWTELDIWQYIFLEKIKIVSLYFSAIRPVLKRGDMLIVINDNRISLEEHELVEKRMVRFRTLGCWPLTGAVESTAQTLEEVIEEMMLSKTSERKDRLIDIDQLNSMEQKKKQGYF
ncbi:sulfate adenylyltransferase subunit CysD [Candidatus Pantoea edessiphila]|uniref:Sulfate adenylyltransferase subunit 2 n=1 Tax=Candidatus Pantoea edessiphila TaxID=2044610 RepID=A0A2P5SXL8_9GAMM|nr:sulfate adenylyltransferase subunit CysD [Candidatus Pantoea edessiphila]MBK4775681.1 sulfate adenylyltransferase subunit CysD [Pantoea sp. Edef]PPI87088.1 sulfate adenylyltransferase subunit CysD [Candidatus Pantoea edessiphila]